MPDIVDLAQDTIDLDLRRSLRAHRSRRPATNPDGFCIDCDESISTKRLAALPAAERCVDCQSAFEGKAR